MISKQILLIPPPRLEAIHVTPYHWWDSARGHAPPLRNLLAQNIRMATLTMVSSQDLGLCFANAPLLQVLRWHIYREAFPDQGTMPSLNFPSLILIDVKGSAPIKVLPKITAPSLQYLMIEGPLPADVERLNFSEALRHFENISSIRGLALSRLSEDDFYDEDFNNLPLAKWSKFVAAHSKLEVLILDYHTNCLDGAVSIIKKLAGEVWSEPEDNDETHGCAVPQESPLLPCPNLNLLVLLNIKNDPEGLATICDAVDDFFRARLGDHGDSDDAKDLVQVRITAQNCNEFWTMLDDNYPKNIRAYYTGVTLQQCVSPDLAWSSPGLFNRDEILAMIDQGDTWYSYPD